MLGALSNRKAWHVLRLVMRDGRLSVTDHCALTDQKDDVIVGSIPNILKML